MLPRRLHPHQDRRMLLAQGENCSSRIDCADRVGEVDRSLQTMRSVFPFGEVQFDVPLGDGSDR
jgi:hypothetical protein